MITPADIETKEFSIVKRGYDEQEVDQFLDLIILDMEKLIRDNRALKEELAKMKDDAAKQVSTESSLYETLEAAKSLMNDIAASAERRAEVLLKNAELEAGIITKEAKESVSRYTEEGNRLMNSVEALKERYKRMLQDEISRIDFTGDAILKDFENDFLADDVRVFEPKKEQSSYDQSNQQNTDLTKTMVIKR